MGKFGLKTARTNGERGIGGLVADQMGLINPALWDKVIGAIKGFVGCVIMVSLGLDDVQGRL